MALGHPECLLARVDLGELEADEVKLEYRAEPVAQPFAALVGAIGMVVALRTGGRYNAVALGNERSAAFGNGAWRGLPVNHQHDKSISFERVFAAHLRRRVTARVALASGLSHLWEVQIAAHFASMPPAVHEAFISCNQPKKTTRGTKWCGGCAKCVFVYALLSVRRCRLTSG